MLKTIIESSQMFCVHQMRTTPILSDALSREKTFITYIDIDNGAKHRVYVAACAEFMQRVTKIFLEEDTSDAATLIDMALETTNLIVGRAKVIAEEENINPYTIGTPYFEKYEVFDFSYDKAKLLLVDKGTLIVAIEALT